MNGGFGLNIFLALAWMALTGSVTLNSLLIGLGIGYGTLWVIAPLTGTGDYVRRVYYWARLVVMFHYELILSSLHVSIDVLTPTHKARPALIEVPLDVRSDAGILLVTNLITLTPGTLSVDVSRDRSILTVHAMFGADDPEAVVRALKSGMERWVMDAIGETR